MTLGFDIALSPAWLVGISLGEWRSDLDFDTGSGHSKLDTTFAALYGSWISERSYVDGTVLYGRGDQEDERLVSLAGIPAIATSKHDVETLAASLSGAYNFGDDNFSWGPYAGLRYIRLEEDAFTEVGASGMSLAVASNRSEALQVDLGLRVWHAIRRRHGDLVPEFSAVWVHDFDIGDANLQAAFTGAPGLGFRIPAQPVERDGVRYGLGLGYASDRGFSTLLRYTLEQRGDFKWQGLQGELRYEF